MSKLGDWIKWLKNKDEAPLAAMLQPPEGVVEEYAIGNGIAIEKRLAVPIALFEARTGVHVERSGDMPYQAPDADGWVAAPITPGWNQFLGSREMIAYRRGEHETKKLKRVNLVSCAELDTQEQKVVYKIDGVKYNKQFEKLDDAWDFIEMLGRAKRTVVE